MRKLTDQECYYFSQYIPCLGSIPSSATENHKFRGGLCCRLEFLGCNSMDASDSASMLVRLAGLEPHPKSSEGREELVLIRGSGNGVSSK
jgi:hypothetical protein